MAVAQNTYAVSWFKVVYCNILEVTCRDKGLLPTSFKHLHHEPDYVRVTMICAIPDPENEHLFSGEGAEHGVWVPAQCCKGGQHSQLPPHGVFDKFNNIQFNFNLIQFNNI